MLFCKSSLVLAIFKFMSNQKQKKFFKREQKIENYVIRISMNHKEYKSNSKDLSYQTTTSTCNFDHIGKEYSY